MDIHPAFEMAHKSTYPVRSTELDRLRQQRGMTLDALALKADIHIKSLKRILMGGRARLDTIRQLAEALGTKCDNLRADIQKTELIPANPATFTLSHSITGEMGSLAKFRELLSIPPAVQQFMNEAGIKTNSFGSLITVQDEVEDGKRTIVVIYGILDTEEPFYVIASVRPSRYELFQQNYRFNNVDIRKFDAYGEILVCGKGTEPSDEIWEKVAEMYQTDPKTLLGSMVNAVPNMPELGS